MRRDRITRGYYTGVPRWRTGYAHPTEWHLIRLTDVIPLIVTCCFNYTVPHFTLALALSMLWALVMMLLRRRRLARECAEQGHDPYRPTPDCVRCWHCGQWLDVDRATGVHAEVEAAAAEVRDRPIPQSRYSDRR